MFELIRRVEVLESRPVPLETGQGAGNGAVVPGWEPRPTGSGTRIILFGDSNSAGQIKFGEERGTLGKYFPGESRFIPTFSSLPELSTEDGGINPVNYSDFILAIGTNDLRGA
jgi:hypothetical protein